MNECLRCPHRPVRSSAIDETDSNSIRTFSYDFNEVSILLQVDFPAHYFMRSWPERSAHNRRRSFLFSPIFIALGRSHALRDSRDCNFATAAEVIVQMRSSIVKREKLNENETENEKILNNKQFFAITFAVISSSRSETN